MSYIKQKEARFCHKICLPRTLQQWLPWVVRPDLAEIIPYTVKDEPSPGPWRPPRLLSDVLEWDCTSQTENRYWQQLLSAGSASSKGEAHGAHLWWPWDGHSALILAPLPTATKAKGLSLDLWEDEQLGFLLRQLRTSIWQMLHCWHRREGKVARQPHYCQQTDRPGSNILYQLVPSSLGGGNRCLPGYVLKGQMGLDTKNDQQSAWNMIDSN